MIAKLAYLTSPAPNRYILHFQAEDPVGEFNMEIEISEGHLANIIADGAHYAFRKQCSNRVPVASTESAEHATEHRT